MFNLTTASGGRMQGYEKHRLRCSTAARYKDVLYEYVISSRGTMPYCSVCLNHNRP